MNLKNKLLLFTSSLYGRYAIFYIVIVLCIAILLTSLLMLFHALITYKAPFEAIALCADFLDSNKDLFTANQITQTLNDINSKMIDKAIISFLFQIFTITFITLGILILTKNYKALTILKSQSTRLITIMEHRIETNDVSLSLNLLFLNLRVFSSNINREQTTISPKINDYAVKIIEIFKRCKKKNIGIKKNILEYYIDIPYEILGKMRTYDIEDTSIKGNLELIETFIKQNKEVLNHNYAETIENNFK